MDFVFRLTEKFASRLKCLSDYAVSSSRLGTILSAENQMRAKVTELEATIEELKRECESLQERFKKEAADKLVGAFGSIILIFDYCPFA